MDKADQAVRQTNDSATANKLVCVSKGYYPDPYISLFAQTPSSSHSSPPSKSPTPLMNRGYWSRVKAVQKTIEWFLNLEMEEGKRKQVVNLGAGYDTTFFRLLGEGKLKNIHWVEMDFPEVVGKKKNILTRSPVMKELFQKQGVEIREGMGGGGENGGIVYSILNADLRSLEGGLGKELEGGLDVSLPTLFLSECVLAYLDAGDGTKIIKWAGETFKNSYFVTYEQILPDDSFGKMMVHNLHNRGCDLRSIRDFPNLDAQKSRYQTNGWGTVFAKDMYGYYNEEIPAEERTRAEKLEWLDELEEWVLIQKHYCIVCAVRDSSVVGNSKFSPPMK